MLWVEKLMTQKARKGNNKIYWLMNSGWVRYPEITNNNIES